MKSVRFEDLSPESQDEVRRPEAMGEDEIDTSDTPEATDWPGTVRGRFCERAKCEEASEPKS
jgi:hypothetical protein